VASVFKRPGRESYEIEYTVVTGTKTLADGRKVKIRERRRIAAGTRNYKIATEKAAELERNAMHEETGIVSAEQVRRRDQDAMKLDDHVAAYVRSLETRGRSKATLDAARRFLAVGEDGEGGIAKTLGVAKLSEIVPSTIERYVHGLKAANRSARTCNWRLALLSSFLSWAVRDGRIAANPCRAIEHQNVDRDRRYERREPTAEEFGRILDAAERRGTKALFAFLAYAAQRRSDAVRLTWGDLDFEAATLTLAKGKAKRVDVLPIAAPLLAELKRLKDAQGAVLGSAYVFMPGIDHAIARAAATSTTATKQERADAVAKLHKLDERRNDAIDRERVATWAAAGIVSPDADGRRLDLHSLRSFAPTELARQGVPPQVVMKLMRHSSIGLTMKYYTFLRVDDLRGGLAALPPLPNAAEAQRDAQAATGTDDARSKTMVSGMDSTHTPADDRRRPHSAGPRLTPSGNFRSAIAPFPGAVRRVAVESAVPTRCSRASSPRGRRSRTPSRQRSLRCSTRN